MSMGYNKTEVIFIAFTHPFMAVIISFRIKQLYWKFKLSFYSAAAIFRILKLIKN